MRSPGRTESSPGAAITAHFNSGRRELAQLEQREARSSIAPTCSIPRHADPDLADELMRKDLGLVRPDEVIVPLNLRPRSLASVYQYRFR